MKTENLYIECESLEQANKVLEVGLNYNLYNSYPEDFIDGEQGLNVRISEGHIFTMPFDSLEKPTKLTYTQFMEKYTMNKFKEVVAKACHELSVSEAELSRMLGFSRNYINQAILEGRSTKWQESTIVKIEGLLKGVVFDKFSVEVDDEVSPKSHNMIVDIGASFNPEFKALLADEKSQVERIIKENTQLKKDKEQLVVHNGKLVEEIGQMSVIKINLQNDKVELVNKFNLVNEDLSKTKKRLIEKSMELGSCLGEVEGLKQDKDGLKGKIVSLEKINSRYKNKYAASVTIGLMIASVLICVILWGVK